MLVIARCHRPTPGPRPGETAAARMLSLRARTGRSNLLRLAAQCVGPRRLLRRFVAGKKHGIPGIVNAAKQSPASRRTVPPYAGDCLGPEGGSQRHETQDHRRNPLTPAAPAPLVRLAPTTRVDARRCMQMLRCWRQPGSHSQHWQKNLCNPRAFRLLVGADRRHGLARNPQTVLADELARPHAVRTGEQAADMRHQPVQPGGVRLVSAARESRRQRGFRLWER
jgi:hypothetical protein